LCLLLWHDVVIGDEDGGERVVAQQLSLVDDLVASVIGGGHDHRGEPESELEGLLRHLHRGSCLNPNGSAELQIRDCDEGI
jgi:hypothetical protein